MPQNVRPHKGKTSDKFVPSIRLRVMWLSLSACGSALLLTMTNHLCRDVAPVPLLWVAPLCLYLLSFILCFGVRQWYSRRVFCVLMVLSTTWCAALFNHGETESFLWPLIANLVALFTCCMFLHGELERAKPASNYLTVFYLYLTAGGAIGGVLVTLIAPLIFNNYYEYPLSMIACWFLMIRIIYTDKQWNLYHGRPVWIWAVLVLFMIYFVAFLSNGVIVRHWDIWVIARNFYGVLTVRVTETHEPKSQQIILLDEGITHGTQWTDKKKRLLPNHY